MDAIAWLGFIGGALVAVIHVIGAMSHLSETEPRRRLNDDGSIRR